MFTGLPSSENSWNGERDPSRASPYSRRSGGRGGVAQLSQKSRAQMRPHRAPTRAGVCGDTGTNRRVSKGCVGTILVFSSPLTPLLPGPHVPGSVFPGGPDGAPLEARGSRSPPRGLYSNGKVCSGLGENDPGEKGGRWDPGVGLSGEPLFPPLCPILQGRDRGSPAPGVFGTMVPLETGRKVELWLIYSSQVWAT